MGHTIACTGYRQARVRTGYEQVLTSRTSDLFAYTAKKPGKVSSISDTGIIVEYDDGETTGYELGRRYGEAAGLTIPHEVKTTMKIGQKVKVGDLICYNDGFFEKDILDPNNVVYKAGIIVKTALMESTATIDDSSSISEKVGKLLTTKVTKVKNVVLAFDQSIHNLVKVGTKVEYEDILCIIEDSVTANPGLFDEKSIETLRLVGAQTPQAKVKGEIERIEVYYHGDKADMSESLRMVANASDLAISRRNKSIGKKAFTGSVDDNYRIDGEPLMLDSLCIKFYISSDIPSGKGDKGVFGNQMKTVFGDNYRDKVLTESGIEVDAIFSYSSILNRIVNSPVLIGTTNTLLSLIGKKAAAIYKGK